jgi:hypothetical protein
MLEQVMMGDLSVLLLPIIYSNVTDNLSLESMACYLCGKKTPPNAPTPQTSGLLRDFLDHFPGRYPGHIHAL